MALPLLSLGSVVWGVSAFTPFPGCSDTAQAVDTASMIDRMERQITAMQAEVKALKKKQAREHQQLQAELQRQRALFEADPYRPAQQPLRAQAAPPFLPPDSPAAPLLARTEEEARAETLAQKHVDLFGFSGADLLPARTASTPYGELTATPPAHPDLYGPLRRGQLQIGGIRLTLGGFIEATGFWRSRTMGADIASSYSSIPWANQSAYYMSSWHQSERQSRFSLLAEGMITRRLEADGYVEVDFQSSGSSSNSRQSNSYTLRPRVLYGELKDRRDGLYFLGGQEWSLVTLFNKGMFPRDEQTPLVIEAQYVPGFNWTRSPQVRLLKTFGREERYGAALSIENPSAVIAGRYPDTPQHQVTDRVSGTGINNPDTYYASDPAPDVVAKVGADPGWGHYELTGLMRFFRTRSTWARRALDGTVTSSHGSNKTVLGGGGGGGMVLPLIDKRLYFQASGLVGRGIGRYGSAGLADFTFRRGGAPSPLPEASLLLGLYGTPLSTLTLYAYAGAEKVLSRRSFDADGKPYGYGNPHYVMAGCRTELSTACAAAGNIQSVAQATAGAWYTAAQGDYGKLLVGAQYSHTTLRAFSGIGGKPHTDDDMVFFSLRYMPFN
ncbi:OmpH family outer membrane protein [Oecophyllibacter saccharovorans]|uniref:Porin n=1 Tax=Oecophyllibacter saccharovorans TaxID=2558360 RepID=A0A506UL81_9PROT|nr:OmpH family outer membrane protein [Oecophyllibacter saccharovorans]TPW33923.1 hypothetical protein E3202_04870 [Oecophyllibacter saccharovorans]